MAPLHYKNKQYCKLSVKAWPTKIIWLITKLACKFKKGHFLFLCYKAHFIINHIAKIWHYLLPDILTCTFDTALSIQKIAHCDALVYGVFWDISLIFLTLPCLIVGGQLTNVSFLSSDFNLLLSPNLWKFWRKLTPCLLSIPTKKFNWMFCSSGRFFSSFF